MTLTYVDAGVLIAAARGTHALSISAREVLDDPNREFASSIYLKLPSYFNLTYLPSACQI
jgi:hypothetical protein